MLPRSLEKLLRETVSSAESPIDDVEHKQVCHDCRHNFPYPFALLRRAGHFQYRDSDRGLQEFNYEDPAQALTEEYFRVLKAISAANQSQVSSVKHSTSLRDASWSRFEDIGFSSTLDEENNEGEGAPAPKQSQGLRSTPASGHNLGRSMTPSWADSLSGFIDDTQ